MPIVVDARSHEDYAAWVKDMKAKMPPPPQPAAAPEQVAAAGAAPAADPNKKWTLDELKANGEKLYVSTCSACHQVTGKGLPPAFPALDGDKTVNGPKAAHIATVLKGRPNTAMAPFAQMSDTDLAAIITYERNAWGNHTGEAIQPAEIAAARK